MNLSITSNFGHSKAVGWVGKRAQISKILLASLMFLWLSASAYFDNPSCMQGAFPLTVGGSRDESVSCFAFHEKT